MRLLLILALSLFALPSLAVTVMTLDDSGNLTLAGGQTMTALEVNGDVTLANDETLDNAADGDVRFTFFDDDPILGEFILESDNAAGDMANNDSIKIRARANDAGGAMTDIAIVDFEMDTVAAGAENSSIHFSVLNTGSSVTPLMVDKAGLNLANAEILDNSSDGEVAIIFNEDETEWGTFSIESSNPGVLDNDTIELDFRGRDDLNNAEVYATIQVTATDVNNATGEDATMKMRVTVGGTETTIATYDSSGETVAGIVDANSFTANAAAGLDLASGSTGALLLGAADATSVEIGDAGVTTDIQGPVTILGTTGAGLDTAGATAMFIAQATATSLSLGASDIDTISLGRITVLEGAGEGLDSTGAGVLEVGAANATKVSIADSSINTDVQGTLTYEPMFALNTGVGVTMTANDTVATGTRGNIHVNNQTSTVTYTLPPCAAGLSATFINSDIGAATLIRIDPTAGDKIVFEGLLMADGEYIEGPAAAGASIKVIAIDATRWLAYDQIGDWDQQTP